MDSRFDRRFFRGRLSYPGSARQRHWQILGRFRTWPLFIILTVAAVGLVAFCLWQIIRQGEMPLGFADGLPGRVVCLLLARRLAFDAADLSRLLT